MKIPYEYSTDYFERLSITEARERGDMHASYLVSKLGLTKQGKATLAEFLLAASHGVNSRNHAPIDAPLAKNLLLKKFKFERSTEMKKRSLF